MTTSTGSSAVIAATLKTWREVTGRLNDAADGFTGDWDGRSNCGDWTNRQLLAHLATGYVVRIAVLDAVVSGCDPRATIDLEAANVANVARLERATIDEIVDEMVRVRALIEALLQRLRAEHLSIRTQLAGEALLSDALPLLCDHDLEHLAELKSTPTP